MSLAMARFQSETNGPSRKPYYEYVQQEKNTLLIFGYFHLYTDLDNLKMIRSKELKKYRPIFREEMAKN